MATSTSTQFSVDLGKLGLALEEGGWVIDLPDGSQAIHPDAPADLVSAYQALVAYGYANGLLGF